jgi:hypothetical protein
MDSIEKFRENNVGGFNSLKLVDVNDIITVSPVDSNYSIPNEIKLREGIIPSNIYFTPTSVEFSEEDKLSDAGRLWDVSVSFGVPKFSPEIQKWKRENSHKRFLLLPYDNNELVYIVGAKESPLELSTKSTVPEGVGDRNMTVFTLTTKLRDPVPFYLFIQKVEEALGIFSSEFTIEFM